MFRNRGALDNLIYIYGDDFPFDNPKNECVVIITRQ